MQARTAACWRMDTACSTAALYSSWAWSRAAAREREWSLWLWRQLDLSAALLVASPLLSTAPSPNPHIPGGPCLAAQLRCSFPHQPTSGSTPMPAPHPAVSVTPLRTWHRDLNPNRSRNRTKTSSTSNWPPCSLTVHTAPPSKVLRTKPPVHEPPHPMLSASLRDTPGSDFPPPALPP